MKSRKQYQKNLFGNQSCTNKIKIGFGEIVKIEFTGQKDSFVIIIIVCDDEENGRIRKSRKGTGKIEY